MTNNINKKLLCKPFIKWVGGKRSVLAELLARIPPKYNGYWECFLGGGALYFELQPNAANLSDINFKLLKTYHSVKSNVDKLIFFLKKHEKNHKKDYYYKMRNEFFVDSLDNIKTGALFIYLNKTCYNGLYRVNKDGKFNVPLGNKNSKIVDEENLRNCSKILQKANIGLLDFSQIKPGEKDFVYFDPPFHRAYTQYDRDRFDADKQKELSTLCKKLNNEGVYFMLSNSDTSFIRDLYKSFHIEIISSARRISCKADQRKKINELIIRNYG